MLFLLGISGFWMDSIPCRCQIGRNTLGETATLATVLWGLRRAMSSKASLVQLILSELMMTCGSKWFLDLGLNVYSSSTLADALTLVWARDDFDTGWSNGWLSDHARTDMPAYDCTAADASKKFNEPLSQRCNSPWRSINMFQSTIIKQFESAIINLYKISVSIFYVTSLFQRLFVDKLCGDLTEAPGSFAVEACKAEKGPQMSSASPWPREQKGQWFGMIWVWFVSP